MDVFCSSELGTIEESSTHVASAVKRTKAVSSNVSRVETKVTVFLHSSKNHLSLYKIHLGSQV